MDHARWYPATLLALVVMAACRDEPREPEWERAGGGEAIEEEELGYAPERQTREAELAATSVCPMDVPATNVATEDLGDGIALVFTTDSDAHVADLRTRVHNMARMHEHGAGVGMGQRHHHPGSMPGATVGPGAESMPSAMATVLDVPQGARLELRPRAPDELEALREQVRMHARAMQRGECPMMARAPAGRRAA